MIPSTDGSNRLSNPSATSLAIFLKHASRLAVLNALARESTSQVCWSIPRPGSTMQVRQAGAIDVCVFSVVEDDEG
ncbi:uncharacterized protein B0H18DRAFT_1050067 [Fomitopsis serialis]|uniref:uncharacterized protein n=1 Tax=Fomitopsis serialis TaxID=139415 RepID=UPI00200876CD|nr:uncharacterized protein B0H18DRAFT_1050067 [Neoantrodia serialis]KAH9913260.1 hypothetical protein B0H18DRAFT_1050067 [Neoantrodia serialis]